MSEEIFSKISKSSENVTEIKTNRSAIDYEVASFNDAIACELIKIRSHIIDLKIKNKEIRWQNFPDEFLKLFWMYNEYPYSAICATYLTPDNQEGGVILLLDYTDLENFNSCSYHSSFELRRLNSIKENRISSGMELPVYIYDPEFCVPMFPDMPPPMLYRPRGKILSITKNEYYLSINLEIRFYRTEISWVDEIFTREIHIYREEEIKFFIPD